MDRVCSGGLRTQVRAGGNRDLKQSGGQIRGSDDQTGSEGMDSVKAKPVPPRVPGKRAFGQRVQGHNWSREDALSTRGLISNPWLNGREPWAGSPSWRSTLP